MKAKILLLSLATFLFITLQSCNSESESMFLSTKTDNMQIRSEVLNGVEAGMLQINAERYNCEVVELGLLAGGKARISIRGTVEDLKALFDYVSEAGEK